MTCWLNILKDDIIPRSQIVWTQRSKQLHSERCSQQQKLDLRNLDNIPDFKARLHPSTEEEENISKVRHEVAGSWWNAALSGVWGLSWDPEVFGSAADCLGDLGQVPALPLPFLVQRARPIFYKYLPRQCLLLRVKCQTCPLFFFRLKVCRCYFLFPRVMQKPRGSTSSTRGQQKASHVNDRAGYIS